MADMFAASPDRNLIAAIDNWTHVSIYSAKDGAFIRSFSVPPLPIHLDRPRSTVIPPFLAMMDSTGHCNASSRTCAGVLNPSVFRGLALSFEAMSSSCLWVYIASRVPFG